MSGEVNRVKFHDVLSSVLEGLAKGKHIYQNLPTRTKSFMLNRHIIENARFNEVST